MEIKIISITGFAALALSTTNVFAAGPNNAVCRAQFPNGIGQGILTIEGGKPVAYRTRNWKATRVSRSGNTIRINQAIFKVKSESATALVGDWTLGTYTFKGLAFSCG